MNKLIYFYAFAFTVFLFSCGGLEKEIDLELPAYESQIVVECYLQPGLPYALALTKSAAYFDPFPTNNFDFLESILEEGAEVIISHQGEFIKLENQLYFDQEAQRLYNYFNSDLVPADFENNFTLSIVTKDGREVRAFTPHPSRGVHR